MPRRRHIAMFTVPTAGHINPSLEIVRELVARGHRVTYTTTEEFAETVRSVGAEPVLHTTTFPTASNGGQFPEEEIAAVTLFFEEAVHVLPQVSAWYDRDRPDLVLYDIGGYPGLRLAHRWGLPAIQISPTYVAWRGAVEWLASLEENRRKDPRGVAYYDRFTAWLAEDGIDTHPDRWVGLPKRSIATIAKALQPHADDVDEEIYTFVGPCLGDRAHQGEWRRPADADKVLLISLGSAYNNEPEFYRACFAAFGELDGWHVVLNTGRRVDRGQLGPAPGNFELHDWLPQLAVLRQSDVFITHAGMGGTVEGLAHGVPMLAIPQAVDQFANAEAIVRLGVGRRLSKQEATAQALRETVLDLLRDPRTTANCRRLSEELRAAGGTRRAVEIIEGYLPL